METDEKIVPEDTQEATSSEAETNPSGASEESVPYSRFKEVIDQKNKMVDSINTLKQDMETLKQQQPEKEVEEPLDWREAQDRAVNEAVSKIEEKSKKIADEKYQQDLAIEKGFEQIKGLGHDVTNATKKAVLTKMIEDGSTNVFDSYLKIKESLVKTEKAEQTKKDGFVPSSQKGSDAGKPSLPYKELRNKSLEEIAEGTGK